MPNPPEVSPLVKSRTSFYFDRKKVLSELMLLPNLISMGRILLIIPICFLYADESPGAFRWALALLLLSYLSDYADGVAARKLNLRSALGLILDPMADKLWTAAMLILVVLFRDLPVWIAVVVVLRDLMIMLLNGRLLRRTGMVMPSDFYGKSYLVIFGILIILLTIEVKFAIWIAYFLMPYSVLTLYMYYKRYKLALKGDPDFARSVEERGGRH
jgi:CDP-diacylglycerol--glycerol-3-phosphate 3-phosphatidyltransferase